MWGVLLTAVRAKQPRCLEELLEHDVGDDPRSFCDSFGPSAIILAVMQRDLTTVKLLSAYGAPRTQADAGSGFKSAEAAAAQRSQPILRWLQETRTWTQLHHVEQLNERRARKLLRDGVDVLAPDGTGQTPVDRAKHVLAGGADGGKAVARLIVAAAAPWSEATHELFPDAARQQAVRAIHLAYHLRRTARYSLPLELWRDGILPHLVVRRTV